MRSSLQREISKLQIDTIQLPVGRILGVRVILLYEKTPSPSSRAGSLGLICDRNGSCQVRKTPPINVQFSVSLFETETRSSLQREISKLGIEIIQPPVGRILGVRVILLYEKTPSQSSRAGILGLTCDRNGLFHVSKTPPINV
jgi:hypothetical protein